MVHFVWFFKVKVGSQTNSFLNPPIAYTQVGYLYVVADVCTYPHITVLISQVRRLIALLSPFWPLVGQYFWGTICF